VFAFIFLISCWDNGLIYDTKKRYLSWDRMIFHSSGKSLFASIFHRVRCSRKLTDRHLSFIIILFRMDEYRKKKSMNRQREREHGIERRDVYVYKARFCFRFLLLFFSRQIFLHPTLTRLMCAFISFVVVIIACRVLFLVVKN
jgi:hypothetical protein